VEHGKGECGVQEVSFSLHVNFLYFVFKIQYWEGKKMDCSHVMIKVLQVKVEHSFKIVENGQRPM
jgi:hypothetical protein